MSLIPSLRRPHIYPRHQVNLSPAVLQTALLTILGRQVVEGRSVERFERAFADYTGVDDAIGLSSGRVAFVLALDALELQPGDEVLVPDYTLAAIPGLLLARGLRPVFVDVNPKTWHLDPDALERAITPRSRAVLATHLFGLACDMGPIVEIARRNRLHLLEDCAQSCGTLIGGQRVGSFGDLAFFSFNTGKNIACFGGGMIVGRNPALWSRVRTLSSSCVAPESAAILRNVARVLAIHAITTRTLFPFTLYSALRGGDLLGRDTLDQAMFEKPEMPSLPQSWPRLAELQARVGLLQLQGLGTLNARTRHHAEILASMLRAEPAIGMPEPLDGSIPGRAWFKIRVQERALLRARLRRKGVDSNEDDMSACSTLPIFKDIAGDCPVSKDLHEHAMEIPNGFRLSEDDVREVGRKVLEAMEER